MRSVRLLWAHARAETLARLRQPHYSVFTLLFPALVFIMFGLPYARRAGEDAAAAVMASFSAYGVIGVVLFQFGVGVATDRVSPWHRYVRTLPVGAGTLFAARLLSALGFALATAAAVAGLGVLLAGVRLDAAGWARLAAGLVLGGVPFGALGFALGSWTGPRAVVPLANLIYFPMAYAGGLFFPPETLPAVLQRAAPYLPTYRFGQVVWRAVAGEPWRAADWLWLAGCAAAFTGLALAGYRRDQGHRPS